MTVYRGRRCTRTNGLRTKAFDAVKTTFFSGHMDTYCRLLTLMCKINLTKSTYAYVCVRTCTYAYVDFVKLALHMGVRIVDIK